MPIAQILASIKREELEAIAKTYTREQWNAHLNCGWCYEIKKKYRDLPGLAMVRTLFFPSHNKFVFETMNS